MTYKIKHTIDNVVHTHYLNGKGKNCYPNGTVMKTLRDNGTYFKVMVKCVKKVANNQWLVIRDFVFVETPCPKCNNCGTGKPQSFRVRNIIGSKVEDRKVWFECQYCYHNFEFCSIDEIELPPHELLGRPTKHGDVWAVRIEQGSPKVGEKVTVTTKSGKSWQKKITKIISDNIVLT
jgi:hypothetical protein